MICDNIHTLICLHHDMIGSLLLSSVKVVFISVCGIMDDVKKDI